MKKLLLMVAAALLLAAGAQARIINPGENQVWWGYFNESDFESGDYTIGTGQAMTLMAGIYIPANHPQLGSASIQAIRVYLPGNVISNLSNMKIWISKELPSKITEADFTQTTLGSLVANANDFKLRTPYEVNNEGFYIGYCVKSTTGYFIRCGGTDAANSFFVGNPEAGMSWSDLNGNGLGKLAFQILVEGGTFPTNSVTAQDFGQSMVLQGEDASVPVTFTNQGMDPIETISYTISTEGGSTTDEKELSLNSLPLNGSKTVAVPFDQDPETRKYQKTITITQVNGKPNTASKNTASGFLITLKEKQPVTPVIEEFTGTWCGWCPRGTVGMEKVHAAYDDQVVQIAAHSGDVMAISDYQSVISTFTEGYPNSITDRRYMADPSYSSLQEVLKMSFARLTQASIALSAEWDSEEQKGVVFNTTTRFAYSEEGGRYGIAYVLVEDGLKGTGSNWAQANYYSGNGTGEMAWWGKQGSSVSGVEYNHVVVAAWSALNGVDGSVDPVIDADTPQEYSYTASIANKSLIQDKTKLKAVVLLIDRVSGQIVNAAQSPISDYGTGIETVRDTRRAANSEIYDLSGRQITNHRLTKGLYIKGGKKVLIK